MEMWLNEVELKILAFLHERVTGYGESHSIFAENKQEGMGREIGCGREELDKATSYLGSWKLMGGELSGGVESRVIRMWLTAHGEAYMRALEHRLADQPAAGKGKKLTVGVLGQLLGTAKETVVQVAASVLAEYLKQHGIPPTR
jgi:hypothetical protein